MVPDPGIRTLTIIGANLTAVVAGAISRGDGFLLDRIADGDVDALATLYDRQIGRLFAVAVRILGRDEDAEEVIQDIFLRVWEEARRYDARRGSVTAWLMIMTRSRAIDRLRARRARPDGRPYAAGAVERLPDEHESQECRLLDDEDAALLRAALNDLPAAQRQAIELAYFGGFSQREIAASIDEPLGTVKTRVRTALLKLRAVLREQLP